MRDPKRIKVFCEKFAEVWENSAPDWRFGQLICNVFGEMAMEIDPFFPEDDKMIEYIEGFFSCRKKNA